MSYGRRVLVEFLVGDKLTKIEGLDVKFDINMPMSSVMTKANISICNLKRSEIEALTTFTSRFTAIALRKRIILYAGYDDELPMRKLFDGDIIQATPTQPPEIWLECEAFSGAYGSTDMFSKSITIPSSVESICGQAAGWIDVDLEWKATTEKTIEQFAFSGSAQELSRELEKIASINVFEEGGKMVVVDNDTIPQRDGIIREISENTGMVFVPKVDYIGIEATILLDSRIKRGDAVKLVSTRVPSANGVYYVYNIRHHGQLRGNAFYTTIKARRENTYGTK